MLLINALTTPRRSRRMAWFVWSRLTAFPDLRFFEVTSFFAMSGFSEETVFSAVSGVDLLRGARARVFTGTGARTSVFLEVLRFFDVIGVTAISTSGS